MKAIFFGSIGTLVETSEIQRNCFNQAFRKHGLDWYWDQSLYREMLSVSGGQARIASLAERHVGQVNAAAIHATKVKLFHKHLVNTTVPARPGVSSVVYETRSKGLKLALVSTTDQQSLDLAIRNTREVDAQSFDLMTSARLGLQQKPSPAAYLYALEKLDLQAADVTAIEDNQAGVQAAKAAGLRVVAFPGENTVSHDYTEAETTAVADSLKSAVFG
jgi:HAD superfamily hydrolase (TIGR01509 family)